MTVDGEYLCLVELQLWGSLQSGALEQEHWEGGIPRVSSQNLSMKMNSVFMFWIRKLKLRSIRYNTTKK